MQRPEELARRPARDHRLAGGAQRRDIAIDGAAVYAERIGQVAHGWLGALGKRLGAQAADAAMSLGNFAARFTRGQVLSAIDRPDHLNELFRPQRATARRALAREADEYLP